MKVLKRAVVLILILLVLAYGVWMALPVLIAGTLGITQLFMVLIVLGLIVYGTTRLIRSIE